MTVHPDAFRAVMGHFPTGVTVVAAHVGDEHHATTVNAFTSVSLDPVLVLVSIDRRSRLHDLALTAGEWAVSVLGDDHEHVSRTFARSGRATGEGLESVPHRYGSRTGAVLLTGAVVTFECRTTAVHDGGDHSLFLGTVIDLGVPRTDLAPLIFYRGGYRTLSD